MTPTLHEAQRAVMVTALRVLLHEQELVTDAPPVRELKQAEDDMAIAARDLTDAIDALPPVDRPRGWARGADGETA